MPALDVDELDVDETHAIQQDDSAHDGQKKACGMKHGPGRRPFDCHADETAQQ
jgi:hypothetical protein